MSTSVRRPAPLPPGLEAFDEAECRRLLAHGGVGRLAMRGTAAPELRPVNFALTKSLVIVRTGDGVILEAAQHEEPAAFEIDAIDRLGHTGWSVIVTGTLRELPGHEANRALPLRPWASGTKNRFVGLSLDHISGLRIPPGRGHR